MAGSVPFCPWFCCFPFLLLVPPLNLASEIRRWNRNFEKNGYIGFQESRTILGQHSLTFLVLLNYMARLYLVFIAVAVAGFQREEQKWDDGLGKLKLVEF